MSKVTDFLHLTELTGDEHIYVVTPEGQDRRIHLSQINEFVLENLPKPVEPEGITLTSADW